MTARNLGVVFGRESHPFPWTANSRLISSIATLMRSRDPAMEFSDMAGKAISVEWLVDNAPAAFAPPLPH
jgi:hypothetical protein